ncbi:MAG: 1-deoxy-D-xylulose-5-phosphate reductoisomerase [bacterium]
MKRVAVLGSTGSVGENALRVIEAEPRRFQAVALAAGSNYQRLSEQISRHRPLMASICAERAPELCQTFTDYSPRVEEGEPGLCRMAAMPEADTVLIALSGAAALAPALAAVRAGKTVALANKECMVMAGELLMSEAEKSGSLILPVDSEHSGVFQALAERPIERVRRIILPASGGPFLDTASADLEYVTPEEALSHPTWSMGQKISIDSATLMNKALEIIEARWLFGIEHSRIEVLIHPESIVHALVEFKDGSVIAQMSVPDMRFPILYALSYPERPDIGLPPLELAELGTLSFRNPDHGRFPAPGLAYKALDMGGDAPAVFAAADEEAVDAFLSGNIKFSRIVEIIAEVLLNHRPGPVSTIEQAKEADASARERVRQIIGS